MTELYLFRHVQSELNLQQGVIVGGRSNHTPPSELGLTQGPKLGAWITRQGLHPDFVEASPAVRTIATHDLAMTAAGILIPKIRTDDRLQELSQGVHEGKNRDEVYTPEVAEAIKQHHLKFKFDEGESMYEVYLRMKSWVHDKQAEYLGNTMGFAFTHGFAIRCYLGGERGWTHAQIRTNDVDNASATHIKFDENGQLYDFVMERDFNISTQDAPILGQT